MHGPGVEGWGVGLGSAITGGEGVCIFGVSGSLFPHLQEEGIELKDLVALAASQDSSLSSGALTWSSPGLLTLRVWLQCGVRDL